MTADDATPSQALHGLTPQQREAAVAMESALVVAGPGSGKTRTLIARLAYLLEAGIAQPQELCAITFTRRAAAELRERLQRSLGAMADRITVGTFHQLALLLRPLPPNVRLISDADRQALLIHVLRAQQNSERPWTQTTLLRRARRVGEAISLYKGRGGDALLARLIAPETMQADHAEPSVDSPPWLWPAMRAYQTWLAALDLEDLDDLLIAAAKACPCGQVTPRYRFIHVDEYQDTNGVQRELLIALSQGGARVFAIGDPDQSIYAFRGADLGNFFAFPQDFAGTQRFFLRDNFRSTATLVSAATALIRHGAADDGPSPRAQRSGGERVQLRPFPSPLAEAIAIAREIERLVGGTSLTSHDQGRATAWSSGRYGFSDIAVLTRTAARADAVALALHREGIPTLRPRRARPPDADRTASDESAQDQNASESEDPSTQASAFATALQRIRQPPQRTSDTSDRVGCNDDAVRAQRDTSAGDAAYADLRAALNPEAESEVCIAHESDEWDARFERVAVLTLHGSKGLEFPVVFLCGSEAELLPGRASEQDAIAEERRLFYVGMTRAKDLLWISHAGPASPFVDALPADCTQKVAPAVPRRAKPPQLKLF